MAGYVSELGAETAARRRRLRKALGEQRATLTEFALLAGTLLGMASPAFGPKAFAGAAYAPFLPLVALAGYLLIESGRQRLIAAGQPEESLRARFDGRVLWFLTAVALVGYATFVWATLAPAPFELAPAEAPADALPVTIGP